MVFAIVGDLPNENFHFFSGTHQNSSGYVWLSPCPSDSMGNPALSILLATGARLGNPWLKRKCTDFWVQVNKNVLCCGTILSPTWTGGMRALQHRLLPKCGQACCNSADVNSTGRKACAIWLPPVQAVTHTRASKLYDMAEPPDAAQPWVMERRMPGSSIRREVVLAYLPG